VERAERHHASWTSAHVATHEKPLNSAWSREESWWCTGVSVGFSRVNSSSKLLVSALPFCVTC
jgi:hypothetical protein